jgi:hypothetical protein
MKINCTMRIPHHKQVELEMLFWREHQATFVSLCFTNATLNNNVACLTLDEMENIVRLGQVFEAAALQMEDAAKQKMD